MSLDGFLIRQYRPEYLSRVHSIVSRTIKTNYPAIYCEEVVVFFLNYHTKSEIDQKAKTGDFIVGFLNNTIIATGYLIDNEIGGVYVDPQYQGKGYGKEIVKELLKIARKKNLKFVSLDSTPIAYNFYLSLGFKLQSELTEYVDENAPLLYYKMYMHL